MKILEPLEVLRNLWLRITQGVEFTRDFVGLLGTSEYHQCQVLIPRHSRLIDMKSALSTKNFKIPLRNQTAGMSGSLEDPCVLPRRRIESNYSFKRAHQILPSRTCSDFQGQAHDSQEDSLR